MQNPDSQLKHKKQIGFNKQQFESLKILNTKYKIRVGDFIRSAIRDKIKRDFPMIEENYNRRNSSLPKWCK